MYSCLVLAFHPLFVGRRIQKYLSFQRSSILSLSPQERPPAQVQVLLRPRYRGCPQQERPGVRRGSHQRRQRRGTRGGGAQGRPAPSHARTQAQGQQPGLESFLLTSQSLTGSTGALKCVLSLSNHESVFFPFLFFSITFPSVLVSTRVPGDVRLARAILGATGRLHASCRTPNPGLSCLTCYASSIAWVFLGFPSGVSLALSLGPSPDFLNSIQHFRRASMPTASEADCLPAGDTLMQSSLETLRLRARPPVTPDM